MKQKLKIEFVFIFSIFFLYFLIQPALADEAKKNMNLDADKEWYKNYFIALAPKLEVGSCFTAHNVLTSHWQGIGEFLEYVRSLPNFETTLDKSSQAGISISCKKAD